MAKYPAVALDRLFLALADKTRLRLLNLIAGREICVCYLVEILAQPQPKISRHLAILRATGLVEARREGKWMHYRISSPSQRSVADLLTHTLSFLEQDRAMHVDRVRLTSACCTPARFVALVGAPAPVLHEAR